MTMKSALFTLALLCSVTLGAQRYSNPVLHLDYSDPDVCSAGNGYYMTASSFNCFPGLPILYSEDLVNWRLIGSALTDYPDRLAPGEGVWAPAIRFHDGWFYIYVGDPDRGIFMVRTQDPAGTWEEPVWVVKEKGFIDPCPLWDSDGRAYLSHGVAGSRAGLKSVLYVAPMSVDGTRLLGPSRLVFDGHKTQPTIEGTKFYKRDGRYYIFAPAGGVSTGWQAVLRSDSPFGPYEEKIVMASAEGTINGPHQGAWVSTPSGDWFLHFQDKGAYGRIVHLQPLQWRSDGWPMIGEDPDGDGIGQPVKEWSMPVARAEIDTQSATGPYGLALDWQYPGVPSPYWHYAMPGGDVRLYSVEQPEGCRNLWDCRNLLQQKFPAERFTVTARLTFRPNPQLEPRCEQAGMAVMGTDYYALRLNDRLGGALLEWVSCPNASAGAEEVVLPLGMLPYADGRSLDIWIKLEVRAVENLTPVPDAVCRFSYSVDGKRYTPAGTPFTAKPGKWIGAKWGFFCNRFAPKNDSGCLDITELYVKPEYAPLEGFINSEADVPEYTLPDLFGGGKMTVKKWEKKRRRQILSQFESEMYGTSPGRPADMSFREMSRSDNALDGLATRKEIRISFVDGEYIDLLLYVPRVHSGPVPAFLGVNFFGNHTITSDPGVSLPDSLRYRRDYTLDARGSQAERWPLETILRRGYAVATFCCEDVAPDHPLDCEKRIKRLYPGYSWGNIAAWAWGLSRAQDYLETDPEIGPVAVFGHSRMGKTAVWAAAKDTRFAMLVSNNSGCGGAAISRRCFGETVRRINTHYPYWFTSRFHAYNDNEDILPFDQHEVLALVAPRPVYVASASEDQWSDPRGEFLGLVNAGPAYGLYGEDIVGEADYPAVEQPVMKGVSGYHIRAGKHQILLYDWERYLDFADAMFSR